LAILSVVARSRIGVAAEGGDVASDYEQLATAKADALVTVKFVLKLKMGGMMGGDQESNTEITGIMIEPKGLVLCSNTQLGGIPPMFRRIASRMGGDASATPTDIKVLVGDDSEGVEAKLLARDTDLDLAWIQIKDPKTYKHVDITPKTSKPKVGQRVLYLTRMGKFFDRVVTIDEGRIGGLTSKPRELYVGGDSGSGVPVFMPNGDFLGVTITQTPDEEDSDEGPMAMFGALTGRGPGLILPASEIAKATERAKANPSGAEEAGDAKAKKGTAK
jgi:hypothetical protein